MKEISIVPGNEIAKPVINADKTIFDKSINAPIVINTLIDTGDLKPGETLTQKKAADLYINPAKKYDPFRKALDAVLIENGLFKQWQDFITGIMNERQSFGPNTLAESLQTDRIVQKGQIDIQNLSKESEENLQDVKKRRKRTTSR